MALYAFNSSPPPLDGASAPKGDFNDGQFYIPCDRSFMGKHGF